MKLTFESNASTGRFAVLDESASRRLIFESYHLTPDERMALTNAFLHVQEKAWTAGSQSEEA